MQTHKVLEKKKVIQQVIPLSDPKPEEKKQIFNIFLKIDRIRTNRGNIIPKGTVQGGTSAPLFPIVRELGKPHLSSSF